MKLFIQFVAALIVAFLVAPSAIADDICLFTQGGPQISMDCCDAGQVGSADAHAVPTIAGNCLEGCCSVAPAQVPVPGLPDRFTNDMPTTVAASQPTAIPPLSTGIDASAAPAKALPADFQSLLQTYRI
jgi:hypothetical protein